MSDLYLYPLYRPQVTRARLLDLVKNEQRDGDLHAVIWGRASITGIWSALAQSPWPEDPVVWDTTRSAEAPPRLRGCFIRATGMPEHDVAALAWGTGAPYPSRGSTNWGWRDWTIALNSARCLPHTPIPIVEWLLAENAKRADLVAGPATSTDITDLVYFCLLGNAVAELAQAWPVGAPAHLCMPRANPEQIYRSLQFWVARLNRRTSKAKPRVGGRRRRNTTPEVKDTPRFPAALLPKVQEIPLESLLKLRTPGVLDILEVLPAPAMRQLHGDPKFSAWLFKFPEADQKLEALLTPKPLLPQIPEIKYIRLGVQTILMCASGAVPSYSDLQALATSQLSGLERELRNPQVNVDSLDTTRVQKLTATYLTDLIRV